MKLAIAVLAMGMCACNAPHGHSDGTAAPAMLGPQLRHIDDLNVGETACTYFWASSMEGHVWLNGHSPGESIEHPGACTFSDNKLRVTVTRLDNGWKMLWRGEPNVSYVYDADYQRIGYYRVTELEW